MCEPEAMPQLLTVLYSVQAISPAMQMHLYEAAQPSPLSSQVGFQQLDTCMIIMKEFRKTYWAADFLLRIFSEALVKVKTRTRRLRPGNDRVEDDNRAVPKPVEGTSLGLPSSHPWEENASSNVTSGQFDTCLQSPNEDILSASELDFFKFPAPDLAYE